MNLREAKKLALSILNDELYVENLKSRALAGNLHPTLEAKLWEYGFGKAATTVILQDDSDLSAMTDAELVSLACELEDYVKTRKNLESPRTNDDGSSDATVTH